MNIKADRSCINYWNLREIRNTFAINVYAWRRNFIVSALRLNTAAALVILLLNLRIDFEILVLHLLKFRKIEIFVYKIVRRLIIKA